MLLGLLFADQAFDAPGLTGPAQLFMLKIRPDTNQLLLPIKESLLQSPLFQAIETTVNGFEMAVTQQMSYATLRGHFAKWGQTTGFELPLKPYAFRRGNGEALDSSCESQSH